MLYQIQSNFYGVKKTYYVTKNGPLSNPKYMLPHRPSPGGGSHATSLRLSQMVLTLPRLHLVRVWNWEVKSLAIYI
jgi:hypothetical protein